MWHSTMYDTTKLTVELGRIVEMGVKIWDFDYPSYYKDKAKADFEQKVIDHYRFRQIGSETVGRWLHQFRTRIKEIMPYYIQLYESQELMQSLDDPFGNVDITETFNQSTSDNNSVETTVKGTNTNNNTHKFSNTPQGSIDNVEHYITEGSLTNDIATVDSRVANNGVNSGSVTHTLTRKGNQGVNTYAHDMKELRETFLNIDLMIIKELNDLFLGVY